MQNDDLPSRRGRDGSVVLRLIGEPGRRGSASDTGVMVPDRYDFAAAFLDMVGIFDRAKCFWTNADPLPFGWSADRIQLGMAKHLAPFNPHLTVVGGCA